MVLKVHSNGSLTKSVSLVLTKLLWSIFSGTAVKMPENRKIFDRCHNKLIFCLTLMLTGYLIFREVEHQHFSQLTQPGVHLWRCIIHVVHGKQNLFEQWCVICQQLALKGHVLVMDMAIAYLQFTIRLYDHKDIFQP